MSCFSAMNNWLLDVFNFNKKLRIIMSNLSDVIERLDVLKAFLVQVDADVEALHDLIEANADLSVNAKAELLAKIDELQAAASVITSND